MIDKAQTSGQLPEEVMLLATRAHRLGQRVVLATGVFDILHAEHLTFLNKAKTSGDVLIVGVESDVRAKVLKGSDRPINSESVRAQNLANLRKAEAIFILPEVFATESDYQRLLSTLKPAILAVSSHSPHLESKQQLMAEIGGKVVIVHQHNPLISTTQILAAQTQLPS